MRGGHRLQGLLPSCSTAGVRMPQPVKPGAIHLVCSSSQCGLTPASTCLDACARPKMCRTPPQICVLQTSGPDLRSDESYFRPVRKLRRWNSSLYSPSSYRASSPSRAAFMPLPPADAAASAAARSSAGAALVFACPCAWHERGLWGQHAPAACTALEGCWWCQEHGLWEVLALAGQADAAVCDAGQPEARWEGVCTAPTPHRGSADGRDARALELVSCAPVRMPATHLGPCQGLQQAVTIHCALGSLVSAHHGVGHVQLEALQAQDALLQAARDQQAVHSDHAFLAQPVCPVHGLRAELPDSGRCAAAGGRASPVCSTRSTPP